MRLVSARGSSLGFGKVDFWDSWRERIWASSSEFDVFTASSFSVREQSCSDSYFSSS